MVDSSTRWEVVNGLPVVRALGHGAVTHYLASLGVARSSAYRWEKQWRWLAQIPAAGAGPAPEWGRRNIAHGAAKQAVGSPRRNNREPPNGGGGNR